MKRRHYPLRILWGLVTANALLLIALPGRKPTTIRELIGLVLYYVVMYVIYGELLRIAKFIIYTNPTEWEKKNT